MKAIRIPFHQSSCGTYFFCFFFISTSRRVPIPFHVSYFLFQFLSSPPLPSHNMIVVQNWQFFSVSSRQKLKEQRELNREGFYCTYGVNKVMAILSRKYEFWKEGEKINGY